MKKDLKTEVEYYANLPYHVVIEQWDDGKGPYYVARLLELPGCMMDGKTPEEALQELEDIKREYFEANLEVGNKMPDPITSHSYSGNIVLRLPSSLHETLAKVAQIEGVSLNQYMVATLARAVGRDEVLIKERKARYKPE